MATKAKSDTMPTGEDPNRPVEHSFARQDGDQKTVVPVLRRLSRNLAKGIKSALEPIAGCKLKIDAPEPEFTVMDAWAGRNQDLTSLNTYQLSPMKGRILVKCNPSMIAALVDAFFGGSIRESRVVKKEFSQTDLRLIERLAKALEQRIGQAWSEFGPFACVFTGHVSSAEESRIAGPNDRIIVQRYRLTFPDNIRFEIEMLYPLDALQSVEQLLNRNNGQDDKIADPVWRDKVASALCEIHLPARSVLARPVMTLPELAALKVGDIIPIPPARNLPLIIGDRVFARGSLGEQNGLSAFKIEHIEKG